MCRVRCFSTAGSPSSFSGRRCSLGLNRIRATRGLVAAFVVTNFVLAPLAWAAAWFGWLGLSRAGNWALADAGLVMLALGAWQLTAFRRA